MLNLTEFLFETMLLFFLLHPVLRYPYLTAHSVFSSIISDGVHVEKTFRVSDRSHLGKLRTVFPAGL